MPSHAHILSIEGETSLEDTWPLHKLRPRIELPTHAEAGESSGNLPEPENDDAMQVHNLPSENADPAPEHESNDDTMGAIINLPSVNADPDPAPEPENDDAMEVDDEVPGEPILLSFIININDIYYY